MSGRSSQSIKGNARPGQVRIIGGQWRGRKLPVADVKGLRPTSDRARETLFNWLQPSLPGARVLDLCAGTGVLGLEALSRGAAEALFVERDATACRALRSALELVNAGDRGRVDHTDARAWLEQPDNPPFDVIFVDPPYASGLHQALLDLIAEKSQLSTDGLLYLETERGSAGPRISPDWRLHRQKDVGQICMQLLIAA